MMPKARPSTAALDELLRRTPQLWRGRSTAAVPSLATGFSALDRLLPGHGWPVGALTELYPRAAGIGELQLLLPCLRRIARDDARPVVMIQTPHTPYAPALFRAGLPLQRLVWLQPASQQEAQWAAEQTLRAGMAGAVLMWSDSRADLALRRLQLAAEDGKAAAFLYRPLHLLQNASPAAVRLALHPAVDALRIDVMKARGGHGGSVLCPLRRAA